MPPLRIGVNALYLIPGGVGGSEIFLRGLLDALAEIDSVNEYLIFTNRETGGGLGPERENFHVRPQAVPAVLRPARILWEQAVLPVEAARAGLDVMLNAGFTSPVLCPCPQVTVMFDMQHKRHPEHFRWWDLPFWRLFLFASAVTSETVIATSAATRSDLLRYYPLPPEKVHTIPIGVEAEFFEIAGRRAPDCSTPFFLCAGTLHPHKNLERLLRVFARFRKLRPEFGLVLAGLHGFYTRETEALVEALDLASHVRITGWIPRDELYEYFRQATSLVVPSTFEGFGIPLVEAMAAGVPAACSRIEPLVSIADDAALLFDPHSDDELLAALVRLAGEDELRARLSARGRERAEVFRWPRIASQFHDLLVRTARGESAQQVF